MSDTDSEPPGRTWLWVIAVMVALLLAYPVARWMRRDGGNAATTGQVASQNALENSLSLYQAGRYQEAIAAAKVALASDANLAEAYNNIAVSYLQLRMFDEATQAAQEAIRIRPDFQLAKNNLAWIQREKANPGPAATATSDPGAALVDLSLQHAQAGRFKECMDVGTQATKLSPGSAQAFNNIGYCAWRLHLWNDAIRNTQEAIRLAPNFQVAKNNLAAIQQEKLKAEGP